MTSFFAIRFILLGLCLIIATPVYSSIENCTKVVSDLSSIKKISPQKLKKIMQVSDLGEIKVQNNNITLKTDVSEIDFDDQTKRFFTSWSIHTVSDLLTLVYDSFGSWISTDLTLKNASRFLYKNGFLIPSSVTIRSSIHELNLSGAAIHHLKALQLTSIEDVLEATIKDLEAISGRGKKSIEEIVVALRQYGFEMVGPQRTIKLPVNTPLYELKFTIKVRNMLLASGFKDIEALINASKEDLLSVRDMKDVYLREVFDILNLYGYKLKFTKEEAFTKVPVRKHKERIVKATLIEDTGMSKVAKRVFKRRGLKTISEIQELTRSELSSMHGMGDTTINNIIEYLKAHNLTAKFFNDDKVLEPAKEAAVIQSTPIDDLKISELAKLALGKIGVKTVSDLAFVDFNKLYQLDNILGPTLREIRQLIRRHNKKN